MVGTCRFSRMMWRCTWPGTAGGRLLCWARKSSPTLGSTSCVACCAGNICRHVNAYIWSYRPGIKSCAQRHQEPLFDSVSSAGINARIRNCTGTDMSITHACKNIVSVHHWHRWQARPTSRKHLVHIQEFKPGHLQHPICLRGPSDYGQQSFQIWGTRVRRHQCDCSPSAQPDNRLTDGPEWGTRILPPFPHALRGHRRQRGVCFDVPVVAFRPGREPLQGKRPSG